MVERRKSNLNKYHQPKMDHECRICGYVGGPGSSSIRLHIKKKHEMSLKNYYDDFFFIENDNKCRFCGRKKLHGQNRICVIGNFVPDLV